MHFKPPYGKNNVHFTLIFSVSITNWNNVSDTLYLKLSKCFHVLLVIVWCVLGIKSHLNLTPFEFRIIRKFSVIFCILLFLKVKYTYRAIHQVFNRHRWAISQACFFMCFCCQFVTPESFVVAEMWLGKLCLFPSLCLEKACVWMWIISKSIKVGQRAQGWGQNLGIRFPWIWFCGIVPVRLWLQTPVKDTQRLLHIYGLLFPFLAR